MSHDTLEMFLCTQAQNWIYAQGCAALQAARHGAEGYTSSRMPQSELPVQDLVGKLASSEKVIQLNLVTVLQAMHVCHPLSLLVVQRVSHSATECFSIQVLCYQPARVLLLTKHVEHSNHWPQAWL